MTRTASSARFESLYAAHRQSVLAYCVRRLGSDEAPDAASDTFAVAWRRIDDVPDGDGALPWLYGVARRVVANRRRGASRYWRMRHRLLSLRPETVPDPAAQVVKRQELRELEEAVGRLRPIDREILLLHTWEELSHAEIGVALGISVGSEATADGQSTHTAAAHHTAQAASQLANRQIARACAHAAPGRRPHRTRGHLARSIRGQGSARYVPDLGG